MGLAHRRPVTAADAAHAIATNADRPNPPKGNTDRLPTGQIKCIRVVRPLQAERPLQRTARCDHLAPGRRSGKSGIRQHNDTSLRTPRRLQCDQCPLIRNAPHHDPGANSRAAHCVRRSRQPDCSRRNHNASDLLRLQTANRSSNRGMVRRERGNRTSGVWKYVPGNYRGSE